MSLLKIGESNKISGIARVFSEAVRNRIIFFLILIGCLFFNGIAGAQTKSADLIISGIVVDSATQKPLGFVTVSLKKETGQITGTTLSTTDGTFRFEKLTPGKYTIGLINLGYNSKTKLIELGDTVNEMNVGTLFMNMQSHNLSEVTITASKPLVKQESDRISYDLQADPESKGSTVLEMMRKVPLLSVDGEDNLLMKGDKDYKILINGKPSSMMERNAKDILRTMPASSIKNIEVIFSPSSKYDAEGVAGLINIITDKKVDNGYNGTLNISERFPVGGPGAGGSFTFKKGKFGMSSLGGVSNSLSPQASSLNNRISTNTPVNILDQSSTKKSDSRNGYIGAELSFEVDSLNLISAQFNINGNRSSGNTEQVSMLHNNAKTIEGYHLDNISDGSGNGKDASLNYQLGFKSNKEQLLTFSYKYLDYSNEQFNQIILSETIDYFNPDYNQDNEGSFAEQTFQVDYIHPIKQLSIEGGFKGILRTNESNFQFRSFNKATGLYELSSSLSDTFSGDQDVYAFYNTYKYNLKNWSFRAGLRLEQTLIDADFISNTSQVKQNHFNVIPSVNIQRKFNDQSSLNLSYINRLQRPGIYQLNPFIDRSNPSFETTGNPNLQHAFTNVIQLSYNKSKKAQVNFGIAYQFFDGLIAPVSVYNQATNITRTSFENIPGGSIVRSNIYINYPVTKELNFTLNTDVRYLWFNAFVSEIPIHIEMLLANVNISGGYRFNKGLRLNGNLNIRSRDASSPQGKTNGITTSSFNMSKDINNKLSFSAGVNNPFTKYRQNREEIFGPNFTQLNDNRTYFRSFSTSLNYRFGKLKEEIKKNKRGIINDDVVNK